MSSVTVILRYDVIVEVLGGTITTCPCTRPKFFLSITCGLFICPSWWCNQDAAYTDVPDSQLAAPFFRGNWRTSSAAWLWGPCCIEPVAMVHDWWLFQYSHWHWHVSLPALHYKIIVRRNCIPLIHFAFEKYNIKNVLITFIIRLVLMCPSLRCVCNIKWYNSMCALTEQHPLFLRVIFRSVRKISCSDYQLYHVWLFVFLFTWNNSCRTGRIFMEIRYSKIYWKSVYKMSY
jgi:hypothetical protein